MTDDVTNVEGVKEVRPSEVQERTTDLPPNLERWGGDFAATLAGDLGEQGLLRETASADDETDLEGKVAAVTLIALGAAPPPTEAAPAQDDIRARAHAFAESMVRVRSDGKELRLVMSDGESEMTIIRPPDSQAASTARGALVAKLEAALRVLLNGGPTVD